MSDFFDHCMQLMRKANPQSKEDGYHLLLPHAAEYLDRLIPAFTVEDTGGLRNWLFELIAESGSPDAMLILVEHLQSDDESLRSSAIRGLQKINTKEARAALYDAGQGHN